MCVGCGRRFSTAERFDATALNEHDALALFEALAAVMPVLEGILRRKRLRGGPVSPGAVEG